MRIHAKKPSLESKSPPGMKGRQFGKWSLTWEKPFRINQTYFGNAYLLGSINGEIHAKAINGKYLKNYTPFI